MINYEMLKSWQYFVPEDRVETSLFLLQIMGRGDALVAMHAYFSDLSLNEVSEDWITNDQKIVSIGDREIMQLYHDICEQLTTLMQIEIENNEYESFPGSLLIIKRILG